MKLSSFFGFALLAASSIKGVASTNKLVTAGTVATKLELMIHVWTDYPNVRKIDIPGGFQSVSAIKECVFVIST